MDIYFQIMQQIQNGNLFQGITTNYESLNLPPPPENLNVVKSRNPNNLGAEGNNAKNFNQIDNRFHQINLKRQEEKEQKLEIIEGQKKDEISKEKNLFWLGLTTQFGIATLTGVMDCRNVIYFKSTINTNNTIESDA